MCFLNLFCIFVISSLVSLSFQQKPVLNNFPLVQNQRNGGRFVLTCAASFGQTPIIFDWKRSGHKIVQDENYQINTEDLMSTLIIKNVSAKQSGNYTCLASNEKGFDSQSSYLNVQSVSNNFFKFAFWLT